MSHFPLELLFNFTKKKLFETNRKKNPKRHSSPEKKSKTLSEKTAEKQDLPPSIIAGKIENNTKLKITQLATHFAFWGTLSSYKLSLVEKNDEQKKSFKMRKTNQTEENLRNQNRFQRV